MNRTVIVIAAVAALATGVVVFAAIARRPSPSHPHAAPSSTHASGIDHEMAAALAMYKAPEGSTPCETAYNAFEASKDVSDKEGVTPVVLRLSPHDDFVQRCEALPPATQKCLAPTYVARHRPDCPGGVHAAAIPLAGVLELKAEDQMPQASEP